MKRTRLRTRPRDRGTDREAAYEWFLAVAYRKPCLVCRRKHPHMQGHHVIPQQILRTEYPRGAGWSFTAERWVSISRHDEWAWQDAPTRSLQDLLWDLRNGIALCPPCHERHSEASVRVPVAKLPAAAFRFASELGLQHRLGPRHYAA